MRLHEVQDDRFHRMKQLNRLYEDKINHLRKYKVTFQNSLSLYFPGFLDLFNDGYSGLAMVILKKYPHPDLIKNKQPTRYIEKHTCHKKAVSIRYVFKILDFANETYPRCDHDDIEVMILQDLFENVEMARKDADETLQKIIQIAETINEYYFILSIDGIAPNLACRILAEIGDI